MGDNKRYISVRLYLPDSKARIEESSETSVDVKPAKMVLGDHILTHRSKREQYKDSRLALYIGGSSGYLVVLSKMAGLSILAAGISSISEDWKGHTLAAMVLVIGCAYLTKDYTISWLKRYWR